MKHLNLLILLLIICHSVVSQQRDTVELIEINHNFWEVFTFSEHPLKDFSGIDTVKFEENGEEISAYIHYQEGKKIWVEGYYDNNQLYGEVSYSNGLIQGVYSLYYRSGKKLSGSFYKDDVNIIPLLNFYENGNIKSVSHECDSVSYTLSFYENGILESEAYFNTSSGMDSTCWYFENGMLKTYSVSNVGRKPCLAYFNDGRLKLSGFFVNNFFLPVGKWQAWYENGQRSREYFYNDTIPNQPEGTWSWWDETGKLTKQEMYENGKLIKQKTY